MPSKVKKPCPHRLCAFLDNDGTQCHKAGTKPANYHGDGEIYHHYFTKSATWVRVYFCDEHYTAIEG